MAKPFMPDNKAITTIYVRLQRYHNHLCEKTNTAQPSMRDNKYSTTIYV